MCCAREIKPNFDSVVRGPDVGSSCSTGSTEIAALDLIVRNEDLDGLKEYVVTAALEFENACRALVADLGLARADQVSDVRRLTGGVASDIAVVSFQGQSVVVKFALAKLAVAQVWYAPVHRGRAEYAWLQAAGWAVPGAVPQLHGWSENQCGFAMEYLAGDAVVLWKKALLDGAPDAGRAARVGATLGRIHAASTAPDFDRAPFQNTDDFEALRLEPYLRFTATRHPDLAPKLNALADRLYAASAALVHGDVSPKNILFSGDQPVILDAECATMGDPAFDVAFCLNHLVLKAFHAPELADDRLTAALEFWAAYARCVTWENPDDLAARVAELLPALMLARVDGKSPVEYLTPEIADHLRGVSRACLRDAPTPLPALLAALKTKVNP